MFTIENEVLKVLIAEKGAELQSIFSKKDRLEYMWSADPAIWPKKSPVLFPIVGSLKENTYRYNGHEYTLSRHGFARDMLFAARLISQQQVQFTLASSEATLAKYPFPFVFQLSYTLNGNKLTVHYQVVNAGKLTMYFSVGGHPAFRLPLTKENQYEDYYLAFTDTETLERWPISAEGLIEQQPIELARNTNRLQMSKALFQQDALVFKQLTSHAVSLRSDKDAHGLTLDFPGFPFLGIWAVKNADFVCIEPWCGIADSVNTSQRIEEKEGIERLEPNARFDRSWSITLF